jgi:formylmethanofuran dehydrogenase subunit A
MAMTTLPSIAREYTLSEIAIMTRAAPAKLLGLADRGHLATGMLADIAVYDRKPDTAAMFRDAALVFKNGELVVRDGEVVSERVGRALTVRPEHDRAIDRRMRNYFDERFGLSPDLLGVSEHAIGRPQPFELVSCVR